MKNAILLGLGNPILSDDGIGNRVAKELTWLENHGVAIVEASLAGFNLLELLAGFEKAVLVDAIQTKEGRVGAIYRLNKDDLSFSQRLSSVHDINLYTAWQLGQTLGVELPTDLVIFAIEVKDVLTFSEMLTPEIEAIVPQVCQMVLKEFELENVY